ncbi:MAG: DUF1684 domain-containing protein [Ktedonobacteraceae bacterium]|nr:DUF1684 domain-containing protein [Ktedonobacteraceae bacterium]
MSEYLELYDYRLRVAALYRERTQALVAGEDAETVLRRFRAGKDDLFAHHPQSALDEAQRRHFRGLRYFPYNPTMRFVVDVDTSGEQTRQSVQLSAGASLTMLTIGHIHFNIDGEHATLSLYWLDLYGGGLFLPFRDTTCPTESYGGGRYLFDTIKGSDPLPAPGEMGWGRITLDFNYAYNPSCAYNDRWVCPLAPFENRLHVAIRAGEMNYQPEPG